MKLAITTLVLGLSNIGFSADERDEQIIKSVTGCYRIGEATVNFWPDALAEDDLTVIGLGNSYKVCVEDTQIEENRLSAKFFNGKDEVVVGPWLYSVADAQPRCPGCYNLKGINGSFNFDGEDNFTDPSAPIKLNLKIKTLKSVDLTFSIAKQK